MATPDPPAPHRVYVLDVSYFSGKLEAYLRWKALLRDGRIASGLHAGAAPPVCRPAPASRRARLARRRDPWNPRPGAPLGARRAPS
jgi:hypothetical protein